MKIVVIGAGKVGRALTEQLVREGHNIVVVDISPEIIAGIENSFDVIGVVGNGASQGIQQEAGVQTSDLVISVTSSDEVNILCCFVAHQLGAPKTIARVRNPEYRSQLEMIKDELGLSMIVNPERSAALEASRILRFPSANDIESFCRGHVELVEYHIEEDSPLCGLQLSRLQDTYKVKILVCVVRRGEEILIPNGDFVLRAGDKINITASPENISLFFKAIGNLRQPVRSVMIVGGSVMAYHLAHILLSMGIRVKIIDEHEERCAELAEELPKADIVCADATSRDLLVEEGITDYDAFVALTGFDEMNIIFGMYAKAKQVPKVVVKVNHISFPEVFEQSGIQSIITPKLITAERISTYVRAMQNSAGHSTVQSLRRIVDNQVEALEFVIHGGDRYIGTPLRELPLRKNILIAAIVRRGQTIIPGGSDSMEKGDSIVVIATNGVISELDDIFR